MEKVKDMIEEDNVSRPWVPDEPEPTDVSNPDPDLIPIIVSTWRSPYKPASQGYWKASIGIKEDSAARVEQFAKGWKLLKSQLAEGGVRVNVVSELIKSGVLKPPRSHK